MLIYVKNSKPFEVRDESVTRTADLTIVTYAFRGIQINVSFLFVVISNARSCLCTYLHPLVILITTIPHHRVVSEGVQQFVPARDVARLFLCFS